MTEWKSRRAEKSKSRRVAAIVVVTMAAGGFQLQGAVMDAEGVEQVFHPVGNLLETVG